MHYYKLSKAVYSDVIKYLKSRPWHEVDFILEQIKKEEAKNISELLLDDYVEQLNFPQPAKKIKK